MLAVILTNLLFNGSFILNGVTASLLVALVGVSLTRWITLILINYNFSVGTQWKFWNTPMWGIYWDNNNKWSRVNMCLLVLFLVAVIFEVAYYFVFLV